MMIVYKKSGLFRFICGLLVFLLIETSLERSWAQGTPFLTPGANHLVELSASYSLPVLRGMRVYPDKPFQFDFVVDSSNQRSVGTKETTVLIKYFLTCLTVPQEDLWVNLSPYERNRIMPDELSRTDVGNGLLQQDKFLKAMASSLTYPESSLGQKFWDRVYKIAYQRFGTTNLPVKTYNKVWIVPQKAIVYDMGYSALVGETRLKVMLEEDYFALKKHQRRISQEEGGLHKISSLITKEIILPQLEKEINEGKNFATVRQIFHSMVLASWFKRALKRSVLASIYVNKKKIAGVDDVDLAQREKIYKEYLHLYKVGAYNYIRDDVDLVSQQTIPRKYFSGGGDFTRVDDEVKTLQVPDFSTAIISSAINRQEANFAMARIELQGIGVDKSLMGNPAQVTARDFAMLPPFLKSIIFAIATAVSLWWGGMQVPSSYLSPRVDPNPIVRVVPYQPFSKGVPTVRPSPSETAQNPIHLTETMGQPLEASAPRERSPEKSLPLVRDEQRDGPTPLGPRPPTVKKAAISASPVSLTNARPGSARMADDDMRTEASSSNISPAAVFELLSSQAHQPMGLLAQAYGSDVPLLAPARHSAGVDFQTSPVTPVQASVTAKGDGQITDFNPQKTSYQHGEKVLRVRNLERERKIKAISAKLETAQQRLDDVVRLRQESAATFKELLERTQTVLSLQHELDDLKSQEENDVIRVCHDCTVVNFLVSEGQDVTRGQPLFRYNDLDSFEVDVQIPLSVNYFGDITASVNGRPAQAVSVVGWTPTYYSGRPNGNANLKLRILAKESLTPGASARVSGRIHALGRISGLGAVAASQSTIVNVREGSRQQSLVKTPLSGKVNFLVHEGQMVKKGQIVAKVEDTAYQNLHQILQKAFDNITQRIAQVTPSNGVVIVGPEEMDALKGIQADLKAALEESEEHLRQTNIMAPSDGAVSFSAEYEGSDFHAGQQIMTINRPEVLLGNVANVPGSQILFSKTRVNIGDPIALETPGGLFLAGKVTLVQAHPTNPGYNVSNQIGLQVMAYDPYQALSPGLPVRVILPTEGARAAVAGVLREMIRPRPVAVIAPLTRPAGATGSSSRPSADPVAVTPRSPVIFVQNIPGRSLTPLQVYQSVLADPSSVGPEKLDTEIAQLNRKLPGASQFSLTLGGWQQGNGRRTFSVGLQGIVDAFKGGISSGNAYGLISSIVGNLLGGLFQHNTIVHQQKLAEHMIHVTWERYRTVMFDKVASANGALIQLGVAQQGMSSLQEVMDDDQRVLKEMQARLQTGGLVTTEQLRTFQLQMLERQQQMITWRSNIEKYTVDLNTFTTQPVEALESPISANLPWNAQFPVISEAQKQEWITRFTSDDSPGPQMKEAIAALHAREETLRLQGLRLLPDVNLYGLAYSTDPNGVAANIVPPQNFTASALRQGINANINISIPLNTPHSQGGITQTIIKEEMAKAMMRLEQTRRELRREITNCINKINLLSQGIEIAQQSYQQAYGAYQEKEARPGIYLPSDISRARRVKNEARVHLALEIGQYLEQVEQLKRWGIVPLDGTLVKQSEPTSYYLNNFARLSFQPLFFRAIANSGIIPLKAGTRVSALGASAAQLAVRKSTWWALIVCTVLSWLSPLMVLAAPVSPPASFGNPVQVWTIMRGEGRLRWEKPYPMMQIL
ncbi:MAG: TolC family protein [Candidatus Omnitrophica bacterium]|nr:TolC family protein [Candidatus Omnitrophota bacterium]